MLNCSIILNRASAAADKSKDGAVTHCGQRYSLKFDHAHWVYRVTDSEGLHVVSLNCKGLTTAKRELVRWLST